MERQNLKILLMQIRDDEVTQQEELNAFIRFAKLDESQFDILNVFKTPNFDESIFSTQYHALFIGGSSDASVLKPEKYPFVASCRRLISYCYQQSIPVFASCFGFQIAVMELGGQVSLDRDNMEMGIYPVELTAKAKEDLLFYDTPDPFYAVSGHQERAINLPENVTLLASSKRCPYHAIKFNEKPFYAFQFHPEVNRQDLINRITRYANRYLNSQDELQQIIAKAQYETDESSLLVEKFVDRVLLHNNFVPNYLS